MLRLALLSWLSTMTISVLGQGVIEYGSNNGKNITVFNTRIYVEEYGEGAPLLLLQGGLGSIKDFGKCIPELSKHFRVIAPDTPGQGRSELPDSISYQRLTEYMSSIIDQLDLDSAYVMGWSDGGIMGLLLAESRPDKVKKVIAVGANYGLKGALAAHIPLDSVHPQPLHIWEQQNKAWVDMYTKTLPRDWKRMINGLQAMWYAHEYFSPALLERINIPVMIAQGDRDAIIPEHSIDMHRRIKGSQLCVLPNTSHSVFNEKPELINSIALEFFRE